VPFRSLLRSLPFGLALSLLPALAAGSTIQFSNTYLRSWNGIIVHEPGAGSSSFLVNDEVESAGPDATLATNLGFAAADARSLPFSLHPSSRVDATNIGAIGYDYAIAEATTWFEVDLTITGGSGPVDVVVETSFQEVSTTDEPGFALAGLRTLRISGDTGIVYSGNAATGSEILSLEHDLTYRIQMIFAAYSRATLGHQTSNERDIELAIHLVPEPGTGLLLAFGLCGLHVRGRRGSGSRSRRPGVPIRTRSMRSTAGPPCGRAARPMAPFSCERSRSPRPLCCSPAVCSGWQAARVRGRPLPDASDLVEEALECLDAEQGKAGSNRRFRGGEVHEEAAATPGALVHGAVSDRAELKGSSLAAWALERRGVVRQDEIPLDLLRRLGRWQPEVAAHLAPAGDPVLPIDQSERSVALMALHPGSRDRPIQGTRSIGSNP